MWLPPSRNAVDAVSDSVGITFLNLHYLVISIRLIFKSSQNHLITLESRHYTLSSCLSYASATLLSPCLLFLARALDAA